MTKTRHWIDAKCIGCGAEYLTCGIVSSAIVDGKPVGPTHIEQDRMCGDCREWLWERMANRIGGAFDHAAMNDWEEMWRVLRRLYCWPHTDDIGGDILYVSWTLEQDGRYARIKTTRHFRETSYHPWNEETQEGPWVKV